jgi:signal transduction histidine kinase
VQPPFWIPLASLLAAGALAAAIAVRDPGRLANRLMAATLLCSVWWSLCEIFWLAAPDAGTALRFARLAPIGSSPLSPLAVHLMLTLLPAALQPFRRTLPVAYALALAVALVSLAGPGIVSQMRPSPLGWTPVVGPLGAVAMAVLSVLPLAAILRMAWWRMRRIAPRPRASPWIEIAVLLPLLFACSFDLLLPLAGRDAPMLGSACVALCGLLVWLQIYRFRGTRLTPREFASEILAMLPDGVALVRLNGRIRAANAKLGELAQRDPDSLLGRPLSELIVEAEGGAGGADREAALLTAAGTRVRVSLSESALCDDSGEKIGRVLVVRDLEELFALRSRLLTSGRLAAVGQLAAGIAHEINNPLAYVRSNVGLLERHWKELVEAFEARGASLAVHGVLARARELLRDAADAIDRVASIVRDVGGFSGKGGSEKELVDPVELLEAAVRVAGPRLRRKASVERELPSLPLIPCRPEELMQVFLNLLLAGIQAIEDQGTVRLRAGSESGQIWIEIGIDGAGLPAEALERIFDPFSPQQSAGLGLTISRQIVERQGGRIAVESTPGRSMRFLVALPTAPPPAEAGA